jgi:glycosyltransferase involved in cell wall biosynthesis
MTETASLPSISVLISTKDRREWLRQALESLRRLDYPKEQLEIVVVEETSAPEDPGVDQYVVLPREGRGFAWTRNAALRAASHPLVAFTDDDCRVDSQWLRELAEPFRDPDVAAVAGGVLGQPSRVLGKTEIVLGFPGGGLRRIVKAGGRTIPVSGLSTVNAAARREVLEQLGGFCDATGIYGGEDSELFGRLTESHRAVFNPKALVYHRTRDSMSGIARWLYRRGISAVMLARIDKRKRGALLWEQLRSSLLLRLGVLTAVLAVLDIPIVPVVALLAVFYYGLLLFRYRFARRSMGLFVLLLTPVTKLVMDAAFDLGRIRGLILWMRGTEGGR